jgi:hypothetical protein
LAEQPRIGSLETVVYKDRGRFRRLGQLARAHGFVVRDAARVKNRLKSVDRSRGVGYGAGRSIYGKREREGWLAKLPEASRTLAEVLYEEHDALVALNAKAEKALLAEARKHREWDWVRTPTGAWIKTAVQRTRGLNRNFNHRLKGVFKGAATTVIGRADDEPLYHHYERLLDGGTKPNLAS